MNGRVEKDMKIYKKIEEELINYPDFITSWYFYLKANKQSAMSCRDYISKISNFLKFINKDISLIQLSDFNENIITRYFIKIQNKEDGSETSISYRQCIWSCLNNFFSFLTKRKLIVDNYFTIAGIERPKGNDLYEINKKRKMLTTEDFQKILMAVDNGVGSKKSRSYQKRYQNRDKAILLMFMTTGMRKTALEEINVRDIDVEKHTLYTIDKGHKVFTYYLTDEIIDVINKWLVDRYNLLGEIDDGALFISRYNTRMSGDSIAELVDKYAYEALGYHISPHKLRSGLVSILYDQTGDIEFCRRAIGHSNVTTTQRYIVTNNDERERTAKIMNNLLN